MYRLFETLCIRNGIAENLPWHRQRLESSYRTLFGKAPEFDLEEIINVPPGYRRGIFRCRLDYDRHHWKIQFTPYVLKEIESLQLVEDNTIDYHHKYTDRNQLDALFALRGQCDDVLVIKDGRITDTSMANVILWNGQEWLTPATPLLEGTCRARLLSQGKIRASEIGAADLWSFSEVRLINAMRGLEDGNGISTGNIPEESIECTDSSGLRLRKKY